MIETEALMVQIIKTDINNTDKHEQRVNAALALIGYSFQSMQHFVVNGYAGGASHYQTEKHQIITIIEYKGE
jgi:hypothetical protein